MAPIATGYVVASPLGYSGAFVIAGVLLLAGAATATLLTRRPIDADAAPTRRTALASTRWTQEEPPMTPLKFAAVSRNYFNMPVWIGVQAGLFRQEGIDLAVELHEGVDEVTARLVDGRVQLAFGITEHVILDSEAGGQTEIIGGNVNRLPFSLIAGKSIRSFEDMRGKVVGVSSLEAGSSSLVMRLFESHGLQHPRDYRIVAVGPILTRWAMLQSGEIDAGLQGAPLNYIANDAGFPTLADPREQFPDFQFTSLNVDAGWARANHDLVVRFMRAFIRSHEWFYANKAGTADIAMQETGVARLYADRAWDEYVATAIFPARRRCERRRRPGPDRDQRADPRAAAAHPDPRGRLHQPELYRGGPVQPGSAGMTGTIRPIDYGARLRIGVILPSGNVIAEPQIRAMLPPGGRLLRHEAGAARQFGGGAAAHDGRGRAGVATSRRCRRGHDRVPLHGSHHLLPLRGGPRSAPASRPRPASPGVVTSDALGAAFAALGLQRLVLLTPYLPVVHRREIDFVQHLGVEVVSDAALGLDTNTEMALLTPEALAEWALEHRDARADGYFLSCTALRYGGADRAARDESGAAGDDQQPGNGLARAASGGNRGGGGGVWPADAGFRRGLSVEGEPGGGSAPRPRQRRSL
ncbi:MAG: ABC transporter substrate-binding protein [Acetobacteraceae bacterium]